MASSAEKIDSATLPASFQETIEGATRQDSSVLIERAGKVVGVVISPRDYALLLNRKRALARLGETVETVRGRFDDLPEDVAIALADEASLRTRDELRAARATQRGEDASDNNGQAS